jgi:hypothetical protein
MRLINSVVGSDTKTLTDDEKLQSFFSIFAKMVLTISIQMAS